MEDYEEPKEDDRDADEDSQSQIGEGQVSRDEFNEILAKVGKLTDVQKQYQNASKHSFKSIATVVEVCGFTLHYTICYKLPIFIVFRT